MKDANSCVSDHKEKSVRVASEIPAEVGSTKVPKDDKTQRHVDDKLASCSFLPNCTRIAPLPTFLFVHNLN